MTEQRKHDPIRDAERSILGSLVKQPERIREAKAELAETDFTLRDHREIYRGIIATYDAGVTVDVVTVETRLNNTALLTLLIDCVMDTPSAANLGEYIRIVKENAERRRAVEIANRITERIAHGEDVQATISAARDDLAKVHTVRSAWETIGDTMIAAYEDIEKRFKGEIIPCTSGIPALDALTGGFFPGELTILGARPSVGKSAFALFVAVSAALKGKNVAFISGEMTSEQIGARLLAHASEVNGMRLRSPQYLQDADWTKMVTGMNDYGGLPFKTLFSRNLEEIVSQVMALHERERIDLLIVDYVQLLVTRRSFEADRLRIGHITKELKAISTELKIPVLALAQIARQGDGPSIMPQLNNLKGSSNMEEDADNVILMHRVESVDDSELNADQRGMVTNLHNNNQSMIFLNVAKQRQGRTGKVPVGFDPRRTMYFPV